MKMHYQLAAMIILLGVIVASAPADIIVFNQDFDGGYTGSWGTGQYYSSPAPPTYGNAITAGVGNPNSAWQEYMTTDSWSNYYCGQMQIMQVYPPADTNPADYTISFDAYGSYAGNIQLTLQSWQDRWFVGSQIVNVTTNIALSAANTWQNVSLNLGSLSASANPTGGTWQLGFQLNSWQWGGPNKTDTLTIDNVKLVNVPEPCTLTLLAIVGLVAGLWFRRK